LQLQLIDAHALGADSLSISATKISSFNAGATGARPPRHVETNQMIGMTVQ
jgi:hypothetical protein